MDSKTKTKTSQARASASAKVTTPNALAADLFGAANAYKMGKQVRALLRSRYPRKANERNASWNLSAAQIKTVRDAFASHPLKVKRAKRVAPPKTSAPKDAPKAS